MAFIINCSLIFSEQWNLIDENNIYNGKTFDVITDNNDIGKNYTKYTVFYNFANEIIERIIISSENIKNETGIQEQIEYYRNGIIEKYELKFTKEFAKIHDFNRIIEIVDKDDNIINKTWYINDIIIDNNDSSEDMNKFQFYNIQFVENEFLEFYEPNENGKGVFSISYKYVSIRSVITFDHEMVNIDEEDIGILQYLTRRFNVPDFIQYYNKKVKVYSGEKYYWLYVQTGLEQYVKGQNATIRYYPILRNENLYLMCVGFYDIKN